MNEITVFEQFETDLVVFEAADAEKKFNVATPEGYAECKAYHVKLRKVYNGTDKLRKKTNDDAQQRIKSVNRDAKKILDRIDAMANPRKAMMDAEDAKIQKQIDDLAEANRLKAEQEETKKLADMKEREDKLKAAEAKLETDKQAVRDEQARIERDKQAEADKLAAVEETKRQAEQDAKDLAAKVEQDKIDAAAKSEQDKQDAIAAELKKAHDEKGERDAKELAEKNEEAERVADVEHRKEIEKPIIEAITLVIKEYHRLHPSVIAKEIVANITDNSIDNLEIRY